MMAALGLPTGRRVTGCEAVYARPGRARNDNATGSCMMLLTLLLPLAVFFGLGFVTQLAEKRWPLRTYERPSPWVLDALFWGASVTATIVYRMTFPHLFARLANISGVGR